MRILHVITSLRTGGAEKFVTDLCPRLKSSECEVEICSFDSTPTNFSKIINEHGIKIHTFHDGLSGIYNPMNIWRLYRLIRKGNYDIVHTHNFAPQLFAAISNIFIKTHLVTTEHSTSNRRRTWKWYKTIDRWMFRQYDSVICVSDQCLKNHTEHIKEKSSKNACVIYNGIDYNKYSTSTPASDILNIGAKKITNVASYSAPKDQPTLIKAMTYLPNEFHLCLVGDGIRRNEYKDLIMHLGLTERVHLIGIRSDISNILAASDYIVMCSHYEGLSLSSLEGMASGKPFLADNVDGLREIVKGYGVLFEHNDSKGFADAIMRLENNPELKNSIIKACQEKAYKYDINNVVNNYTDLYNKILHKNKA